MRRLIVIGWMCIGLASSGYASDIPPAYRNIARAVGVPETILYAIALQESRVQLDAMPAPVPWPWTLNVDGTPRRFANRAAMAQGIDEARTAGARFIDVGAMQINLHFNGYRFASSAELLDPYSNIRVAAEILQEEQAICGDWWCAVGRYHSRTPARARQYRQGVERWATRLGG